MLQNNYCWNSWTFSKNSRLFHHQEFRKHGKRASWPNSDAINIFVISLTSFIEKKLSSFFPFIFYFFSLISLFFSFFFHPIISSSLTHVLSRRRDGVQVWVGRSRKDITLTQVQHFYFPYLIKSLLFSYYIQVYILYKYIFFYYYYFTNDRVKHLFLHLFIMYFSSDNNSQEKLFFFLYQDLISKWACQFANLLAWNFKLGKSDRSMDFIVHKNKYMEQRQRKIKITNTSKIKMNVNVSLISCFIPCSRFHRECRGQVSTKHDETRHEEEKHPVLWHSGCSQQRGHFQHEK